MGIEGIADEIEMPFGYDYYDLPLGMMVLGVVCVFRYLHLTYLDRMCQESRAEIQ